MAPYEAPDPGSPGPGAIGPDRDGLPAPRRYFALATLYVGLTLAVLDGTIANVALPTIAQDFHAEAASSIWIVNAYQMAIVISLLPLASLGEIYGYRRVYLWGIALFTVASLGCVMSNSLATLTISRAIQGFGAAGLMSVNAAVLRYTVSKDRFGSGIGVIAMVVAAASTVGPAFAGIALSMVSWQWLFALNLPLGVLTLLLGWRSLPESHLSPQSFDWISAALSAVALGVVITLIDSLGHGLAVWIVSAQVVTCITAFTLLIGRERHRERPLLPLDLLRIPIFSLSLGTSVASFAAQLLAFVSLPFTFQMVLGFPTEQVGLLMMPWPAAIAVVAPLSGRLADRFDAALLGAAGLILLALGLFALWILPAHPTPLDISWRMALCGVGFGMFQAPNNRTMVGAAPKARSGAASGLLSTARLTGQSIGAALVSLLLAKMGIAGANWALLVAAGFAAIAAMISLTKRQY